MSRIKEPSYKVTTTNTDGIIFNSTNGGNIVLSATTGIIILSAPSGVTSSGDCSLYYTDRSFVDKGYVDSKTISGATNIGSGTTIYSGISGQTLIFNTIIGSGNTTVQKIGNEIIIATVDEIETVSRTIYVSTTGDDETGTGLIAAPFRNILRALQDIKDNVEGVTITISLGGIGDFPVTYDEMYELAKKTFINSILEITGSDYTTIESGFTLTKTANRCFAYTLTKAGVTVTIDQYRDYFISTGSAYYPIAYNASGTTAFEVEYLHESSLTPTSIIEWGATITNPGNFTNLLDLSLKNNSIISFNNLNFNNGTNDLAISNSYKEFNNIKFSSLSIKIGDNSAYLSSQNFISCIFINSATVSNFFILGKKANTLFTRCLIEAKMTTQAALVFNGNNITSVNNAFYINGNNVGTAIYSKLTANNYFSVSYRLKVKGFTNFLSAHRNMVITAQNSASVFYTEFTNVTNLLSSVPTFGLKLELSGIYGSLPTNIINGVTSGYIFVDPKNDIHISVPGVYGEYEPSVVVTLANNSGSTIIVGDITQNKFLYIDYTISRSGLTEGGTILMTNKTGTDIVDNDEFDDTGVTFTKIVVGSSINLGWTTTNTGSSAILTFSVRRILT
jgi:hypothetical protein